MSTPAKRHIPDVRFTQHGGREKGHYGSAGDVRPISRAEDKEDTLSDSRKAVITSPQNPASVLVTQQVCIYDKENWSENANTNPNDKSTEKSSPNMVTDDAAPSNQLQENTVTTDRLARLEGQPSFNVDLMEEAGGSRPKRVKSEDFGLSLRNSFQGSPHICTGCSVDPEDRPCWQQPLKTKSGSDGATSKTADGVTLESNTQSDVTVTSAETFGNSDDQATNMTSPGSSAKKPKRSYFHGNGKSLLQAVTNGIRSFKLKTPKSKRSKSKIKSKESGQEMKVDDIMQDCNHIFNTSPTSPSQSQAIDIPSANVEGAMKTTNSPTSQSPSVIESSSTEIQHGILLKESPSRSTSKRASSVTFSDEVTIETFSASDPSAMSSKKGTLSRGDGPFPIASQRLSAMPTSDPDPLLQEGSEEDIVGEVHCHASPPKIIPKRRLLIEDKTGRKDSLPKDITPTQLLHWRQKDLASRILVSESLKPKITVIVPNQNVGNIFEKKLKPKCGNGKGKWRKGDVSSSDDEFEVNIHAPCDDDVMKQKEISSFHAGHNEHEKFIFRPESVAHHGSADGFKLQGLDCSRYLVPPNKPDTHMQESHPKPIITTPADTLSEITKEKESPKSTSNDPDLQKNAPLHSTNIGATLETEDKHSIPKLIVEVVENSQVKTFSVCDKPTELDSDKTNKFDERIDALDIPSIDADSGGELDHCQLDNDTFVIPSDPNNPVVGASLASNVMTLPADIGNEPRDYSALGAKPKRRVVPAKPSCNMTAHSQLLGEMEEMENLKKQTHNWRERCKRKQRLDDLQHKAVETKNTEPNDKKWSKATAEDTKVPTDWNNEPYSLWEKDLQTEHDFVEQGPSGFPGQSNKTSQSIDRPGTDLNLEIKSGISNMISDQLECPGLNRQSHGFSQILREVLSGRANIGGTSLSEFKKSIRFINSVLTGFLDSFKNNHTEQESGCLGDNIAELMQANLAVSEISRQIQTMEEQQLQILQSKDKDERNKRLAQEECLELNRLRASLDDARFLLTRMTVDFYDLQHKRPKLDKLQDSMPGILGDDCENENDPLDQKCTGMCMQSEKETGASVENVRLSSPCSSNHEAKPTVSISSGYFADISDTETKISLTGFDSMTLNDIVSMNDPGYTSDVESGTSTCCIESKPDKKHKKKGKRSPKHTDCTLVENQYEVKFPTKDVKNNKNVEIVFSSKKSSQKSVTFEPTLTYDGHEEKDGGTQDSDTEVLQSNHGLSESSSGSQDKDRNASSSPTSGRLTTTLTGTFRRTMRSPPNSPEAKSREITVDQGECSTSAGGVPLIIPPDMKPMVKSPIVAGLVKKFEEKSVGNSEESDMSLQKSPVLRLLVSGKEQERPRLPLLSAVLTAIPNPMSPEYKEEIDEPSQQIQPDTLKDRVIQSEVGNDEHVLPIGLFESGTQISYYHLSSEEQDSFTEDRQICFDTFVQSKCPEYLSKRNYPSCSTKVNCLSACTHQQEEKVSLLDEQTKQHEQNDVGGGGKYIKILSVVELPEHSGSIEVELGSTRFTVGTSVVEDGGTGGEVQVEGEVTVIQGRELLIHEVTRSTEEGSPERSQKLFGSSQTLDRRDGPGKRKPVNRGNASDSRLMMDKEVVESQNRKLQTEVSTLQTENKLLKEKYNRAQARISDLERDLAEAQDDLSTLQENLDHEMSELTARTKHEMDRDRTETHARILSLSKQNETLKTEVASLEKKLEASHRANDLARGNSEKARTLEAYKSEIASLKDELHCVKSLLEQSEKHVHDEEKRHAESRQEIIKLTELKNALQQHPDTVAGGTVTDTQVQSLEKRLKVTEERLHQERADRANNLSTVEDKLLTENARLQAAEKDLTRQLNREKEKNRNLDQRLKQVREENEKLRLAMPFDDSTLLSNKSTYDIPYGSHSNERADTLKPQHVISEDMNHIMSQIQKRDGLVGVEEEAVICMLWNKRELAYRQLQEYDLQLKELQLNESNALDGLKQLREAASQSEEKLRKMSEEVEDARSQAAGLDEAYKQQLNVLVHERHDAFARLKTTEDLLEAVRAENQMLHQNIGLTHTSGGAGSLTNTGGVGLEATHSEIARLKGQVSQLDRAKTLLDSELSTLRVQLEARNKTLQDVQSDLALANRRLQGDDSEDEKQRKINSLTAQVNELQVELGLTQEKAASLTADNSRLDGELSAMRKQTGAQKARLHKTEQIDTRELAKLKDNLVERSEQVKSLHKQLEDLENELQKARQDLYIEQMHSSELETENETLTETVAQRAQMFEALSGTEREHLAQYQILKDTLDNVSQELAQKHAQIISLDVNLSGQRDRCVELEEQVARLRRDGAQEDREAEYTQDEHSAAHQLRINELQKERGQLKQELERAYSAIQAAEEQYRTLQLESSQLEQELVKEKTVILQITAEKGEIEQHLEELAEEHESLITEKNQAEEDTMKLETKLQEILQKYEAGARKQHDNFEKLHPTLPPEAKKLVQELDSVRLVVEGKEKEVAVLKDKINRQHIEIDFLHRKVELIHNDSIANREDVARMISELTLKMKEAVSTREVNQYLVGERTKLQNEKSHLEQELQLERRNNDDRKQEIHDVIRKIERTETTQKSTEKDSRNKESMIVSLEADLRDYKHSVSALEKENDQLKDRVDHLDEEVHNLTAINSTLETRLDMEHNSLSEEKNSVSKWKEDFTKLSHDTDLLRHEHSVLSDKYEAEIKTVEKLKHDLAAREEELQVLNSQLTETKFDLDTHRGQLLITKDTVQKLGQEKGSVEQDYEGMCRSLTEKERQLAELRERLEERLAHVKTEHAQDRSRLEQERNTATQECEAARKEKDTLNEQLRQKEIQLNTFGKTLQELEATTREKKRLEVEVSRLQSTTGDSKVMLEGQRKEVMALNEALAKQQERSTRLEAENHLLQSDLKTVKDSSNMEGQQLKLTITELKAQHENERSYLNDNLAQVQSRLRSVEASLASAASDRDAVQAKCRLQEKTLEDLQTQLSDENTGRRLAEQSIGQLRLQLEDAKNDKNVSEARYVEMKAQLSRAEDRLRVEEEKSSDLGTQLQELTAVSHTSQSNVQAKSEQVDILQKEISRLKQMLETQKQTLNGKLKKSQLDSKQQIESVTEEREKLQLQLQQVGTDLDTCREHIAAKNKDNLKLQEEILVLEDTVRNCKLRQKQAEDSLRQQTDMQTELTARFEAQDEELRRLRTFLAKKVEESGDADKTMWQEMNRVIQELSHQMQNHLDAQRNGGLTDGRTADGVQARFRKQVAELQGELKTERALHEISKTSLQALEEDCARLRKQLSAYRRREPPPQEKKYKNRMEAINAIIARSQSQAQALLASGGYHDDSILSPRGGRTPRSYHSPRATLAANDSPDNSYTEDLSVASLPAMHYGTHTKRT